MFKGITVPKNEYLAKMKSMKFPVDIHKHRALGNTDMWQRYIKGAENGLQ